MAAERGEIPKTFLIPRGGPVWDSNVFLKSVVYWPTISKFRGGPVKKNHPVQDQQISVWQKYWSLKPRLEDDHFSQIYKKADFF